MTRSRAKVKGAHAYDRGLMSTLPPPPDPSDAAALEGLRAALERAEFTVERVEETLGAGEVSTAPAEVAVHERRLRGGGPFELLSTLFLLGRGVPAGEAERALGPPIVGHALRLGLVSRDGGQLEPHARLVPHGDYYIASDLAGTSISDQPSEWVAGVQAPSVTLAKLAVRRQVRAALDVGTGCGIQALLAAKHSERVVATDLNERALAFAAFNRALNGEPAIELRSGDAFAPVEGERFGLVVSNPPYVISPDTEHLYRDSGRPGDEASRRIVEAAPRFLEEGGFAHVLVSWAHGADGDWETPLRGWVEGSGCDAWLLHYKSEDPLTHASNWLRPLAGSPDAFAAGLDRWVAYLRDSGIDEIAYGAVVLRRRSGPNWVRTDEIPFERLESASEHTLRVFAAADFLADSERRALLDQRLVLVVSHRVEQAVTIRDGRLEVDGQSLVLTDGLGFRAGLDRYAATLVRSLSTPRPLREVLAEGATELELDEADRERYVAAALVVATRLLELGFVVRA
jgi:hypothetical protein